MPLIAADYKPQIIVAVQNTTGRTLTLNGPVRLRRSLWPTIEVSDVTLANLPGGSRPDIARAERIEAQLSLPALLWHQIDVVKLTLVDRISCSSRWAARQTSPSYSAHSRDSLADVA
jgi:uncharacterized protein involved in outer membrane biogenesis